VVQTHLAESKTQAVLGLRKYGRSLVAHLQGLGVLGPRFSAAHGIWLDGDDIARLSDAGVGVVHNPMSNLRIGSGVAPARALLEAGVRLGIGTDASNTSDGQNMFEAQRLAALLSRVADADPARWLSVEEAFRAATEGSAAILGFDRIGRLEPAYRADIVFLDIGHINYVPLRNPLRQLVFAENGAAIDSVMIGGRFVLRAGRMLTLDETRLRRQVEAAVDRLDAANTSALETAEPFRDLIGHFCLAHARAPFHVHRRLPDAI
jgi:guanine deaminase